MLAIGQYEHFAAYLATSLVLAFGYRDKAKTILIALILSGFSGVLEVLQLRIPGRHSQLIDIVISSLGACTEVLMVSIVVSFLNRSEQQSS